MFVAHNGLSNKLFCKKSAKQRTVYLRVRDKKTEKRIATGIKVDESEISQKTKKIKNFEKAQAVEKLKIELMLKMNSMAPEINYNVNMDASRIASTIVTQEKAESLDSITGTFAERHPFQLNCRRTTKISTQQNQQKRRALAPKRALEFLFHPLEFLFHPLF